MRTVALALLLAVAGGSVTTGVVLWSVPGGFIVGGLLLAGWSVLVLAEARG